MANRNYVVLTPARNEADYIVHTLRSMAAQEEPPLKWIVISDESTDGTDDLVREYASRYDWIELLRVEHDDTRNFGAKVRGFNAGYARVRTLDYAYIANLDADVSFGPGHFSFLLDQFERLPDHGLIGTVYIEHEDEKPGARFRNTEHVNGSLQFFRREAFEAIGGYQPIPIGGIDWVAEIKTRMAGWKTHSFSERHHFHHKPFVPGTGGLTARRFKYGFRDYCFGSHPLFQFVRGVNQMLRRPYVVGGLALMLGYAWGYLKRPERPVGRDIVRYYRREQMRGLWRRLGLGGSQKGNQ